MPFFQFNYFKFKYQEYECKIYIFRIIGPYRELKSPNQFLVFDNSVQFICISGHYLIINSISLVLQYVLVRILLLRTHRVYIWILFKIFICHECSQFFVIYNVKYVYEIICHCKAIRSIPETGISVLKHTVSVRNCYTHIKMQYTTAYPIESVEYNFCIPF